MWLDTMSIFSCSIQFCIMFFFLNWIRLCVIGHCIHFLYMLRQRFTVNGPKNSTFIELNDQFGASSICPFGWHRRGFRKTFEHDQRDQFAFIVSINIQNFLGMIWPMFFVHFRWLIRGFVVVRCHLHATFRKYLEWNFLWIWFHSPICVLFVSLSFGEILFFRDNYEPFHPNGNFLPAPMYLKLMEIHAISQSIQTENKNWINGKKTLQHACLTNKCIG